MEEQYHACLYVKGFDDVPDINYVFRVIDALTSGFIINLKSFPEHRNHVLESYHNELDERGNFSMMFEPTPRFKSLLEAAFKKSYPDDFSTRWMNASKNGCETGFMIKAKNDVNWYKQGIHSNFIVLKVALGNTPVEDFLPVFEEFLKKRFDIIKIFKQNLGINPAFGQLNDY